MYKDLLQSEKEYEFPKHAGKEKRALKSKMAGGGRERVAEWDDSTLCDLYCRPLSLGEAGQ